MASAHYSEGRSAAEWALHQILNLIQARTLGPGDRLSPERELGTQLGVSRGSVREAISALVTMGILETRQGAGVFVTSLGPATVLPSLTHVLGIVAMNHPAEITRLHALVEGSAAARAAARATPESLGPLLQALNEIRLADHEPAPRGRRDQFKATISRLSDDRFHRAIAGIAADPVADGMIMLLRGSRDAPALRAATHDFASHEALAQAIADQEPDLARNLAERIVRAEHTTPAGVVVPGADVPRAVVAPSRPSPARQRAEPPAGDPAVAKPSTPAWFRDAKFGLIVHWGLYSIPGWAPVPPRTDAEARATTADGPPHQYFAEWYEAAAAQHGSVTAEYHQRVHGGRPYSAFRPPFEAAVSSWSPHDWLPDVASSGARYVVLVAKHHDGYLLWPSRVRHPQDERWRSARDIVGETATAVRAAGLRFGVFYSSGDDWSYTRQLSGSDQASDVQTSRPAGADFARYVEAHWRELIERYRPDGLWNDTGYPAAGDAQRLIDEFHAQEPDGVVTDRFRTSSVGPVPVDDAAGWESVRPIGLSFGWNRQETPSDALSGDELVLTLMDVVAGGGNLLLGVSPDATGALPAHQRESLAGLGRWLARFGEAVHGTRAWHRPTTRTTAGRSVWFTKGDDDLFVTVDGTGGGDVELDDVWLDRGHEVTALETRERIEVTTGVRGSVLTLPPGPADSPVTVLRVSPQRQPQH